jgi:hypothetical protein
MKDDARKRLRREKMRAPTEARRVTVGFRVSESVRKRLQDEADKSARSLSQEAEHRLETSLDVDRFVQQTLVLAYGEDIARAMFTMGDTVRTYRVVGELSGMSEPNRKTLLAGFSQGLHGLIDSLLKEPVK